MANFSRLAIAVAGLFSCVAVQAAQIFDYSYQFSTGEKILGSFTGTASGNKISDLSLISGKIAGGAYDGYLFHDLLPGSYNDTNGIMTTGAVVSFNGLESNFFFTNATQTNWFYVVPFQTNSPNGNATQARLDNDRYIDFNNGSYTPSRFSVVAEQVIDPAAVPEPASLALLGMGLIGFAASRRKSAK